MIGERSIFPRTDRCPETDAVTPKADSAEKRRGKAHDRHHKVSQSLFMQHKWSRYRSTDNRIKFPRKRTKSHPRTRLSHVQSEIRKKSHIMYSVSLIYLICPCMERAVNLKDCALDSHELLH